MQQSAQQQASLFGAQKPTSYLAAQVIYRTAAIIFVWCTETGNTSICTDVNVTVWQ